jgi:hypothetical protein
MISSLLTVCSPSQLRASKSSLEALSLLAIASSSRANHLHPSIEKGQAVPLESYKGKVVLIVNTASKCGFTPQYEGLEKLYKKVKETHGDDFVILGFPCNQFGGQEPGTDDDIQSFCQINYGVSFPIVRTLPQRSGVVCVLAGRVLWNSGLT